MTCLKDYGLSSRQGEFAYAVSTIDHQDYKSSGVPTSISVLSGNQSVASIVVFREPVPKGVVRILGQGQGFEQVADNVIVGPGFNEKNQKPIPLDDVPNADVITDCASN